jgi:DNA-binding Xre family transcriptional regulator
MDDQNLPNLMDDPAAQQAAPVSPVVPQFVTPQSLSPMGVSASGVPAALDPNIVSAMNLGGPADVQGTVSSLKSQLAPKPIEPTDYAAPQAAQVAPQTPSLDSQKLSPEMQSYTDEYGKQQDAQKAIFKAEADKSTADAATFANANQQLAASQGALKKLHDGFNSKLDSKMADMDGISKQLANQDFTTPKVDENHFWGSRSTGQSILAGLAMALGAVGGGFSHDGKNGAVDVINKAIDRDIETQKFNITKTMQERSMKNQNLRDQAGLQQNMLSNLRGKFQDDTSAELAFKTIALERTQQQLNKNAAVSASPILQQKAALVNSQLEQTKQQTIMQLKQQMYQRTVLKAALGEGDPTKISPQVMSILPAEDRKIIEDRKEKYIPGWGEATTKEGAKAFRESSAEARTALDGIAEIKKLAATTHALSPITDREKVEQIRTRMTSLIGNVNKSLNKTSRLSEVDVNLAHQILGDPTAATSLKSIQLKKLDTVGKILQNDVNNQAESNGIQRKQYSEFNKASFPTRPLK